MKELIELIREVIGFAIIQTRDVEFTVGAVLAVILAFVITNYVLRIFRKIATRKLPDEDKNKFVSIFQFIQYLVYVVVVMFTLNASGVNISVLLTASAAIFIGLGFALQQLFQDVISGVLIILDQSLHVGDVIEVQGKVCRVEKISLRSTKAVTRNGRVMVIPNHKFLSDILFNYTQNSRVTREFVEVGVAYGSDTRLVEQILLECAAAHPRVLNDPIPVVLFEDFADSSLQFILFFYIEDAFGVPKIKSDLRFAIDQSFRNNKITIPFPQRDVHLYSK